MFQIRFKRANNTTTANNNNNNSNKALSLSKDKAVKNAFIRRESDEEDEEEEEQIDDIRMNDDSDAAKKQQQQHKSRMLLKKFYFPATSLLPKTTSLSSYYEYFFKSSPYKIIEKYYEHLRKRRARRLNSREIDTDDLNQYKNLSEFFRRSLKPHARTVDENCCLTSPCDGKVLNCGKVEKGLLEQVKGVNYSLKGFLGVQNWPKQINNDDNNNNDCSNPKSESMSDMQSLKEHLSDENTQYEKAILYNPNNCLYHCVIYLAPGDYHRFHSPTDWTIFYRRHFPGELFSVNPSIAKWLQGLFNLNERVVYYGLWEHGFFSMAPVGATNVGSIRVFIDEKLATNNKQNLSSTPTTRLQQQQQPQYFDKTFLKSAKSSISSSNAVVKGMKINKGDIFGEFNLGSTIVLIFEAPANFQFNIKSNEKVRFGQQLGKA